MTVPPSLTALHIAEILEAMITISTKNPSVEPWTYKSERCTILKIRHQLDSLINKMAGSTGSNTSTTNRKDMTSSTSTGKSSALDPNNNSSNFCHCGKQCGTCYHQNGKPQTAQQNHQRQVTTWLTNKYTCVDYDKDLKLKHFKGLETLIIEKPRAKFPILIPTHVSQRWSSDVIENLENHMMDEGDILLYTPPKCGKSRCIFTVVFQSRECQQDSFNFALRASRI